MGVKKDNRISLTKEERAQLWRCLELCREIARTEGGSGYRDKNFVANVAGVSIIALRDKIFGRS